jgi:hypothetical protein
MIERSTLIALSILSRCANGACTRALLDDDKQNGIRLRAVVVNRQRMQARHARFRVKNLSSDKRWSEIVPSNSCDDMLV